MSAAIAKQNEPTMDEILASIRKIISDDLGETPAPTAPALDASSPETSADIFELSAEMALPMVKESSWNMPLGRREVSAQSPKPEPSAPFPSADPVAAVSELAARMANLSSKPDPDPSPAHREAPVAPATESAVSSAFGSLRQSLERESSTEAAVSSAMRTVVEAALRPMLKDWLDTHLPAMVERLVKAEIERMAKKG
jgi:cell pole-organizing protein PopZ